MSHDNISDIRKVLYGDLNPQLPDTHDEDYYVPELRQLPRTEPIYTSLCRLSFQVPAPSTKVQYYCSRIDNWVVAVINKAMIDSQSNDKQIILAVRMKLQRAVESTLRDVQRIIKENNFDIKQLFAEDADFSTDLPHFENNVIFNYIKVSVIYCYLEFQAQFKDFIPTNKLLTQAYFYNIILKQAAPSTPYITEIEPVTTQGTPAKEAAASQVKPSVEKETLKSFTYESDDWNDNLMSLYMALSKQNGHIATNTKPSDFKRLFQHVDIVTPIVWLHPHAELAYLIKYILFEKKYIKAEYNMHWKITAAAFVDKNGNHFTRQQLHDAKGPNKVAVIELQTLGDKLA